MLYVLLLIAALVAGVVYKICCRMIRMEYDSIQLTTSLQSFPWTNESPEKTVFSIYTPTYLYHTWYNNVLVQTAFVISLQRGRQSIVDSLMISVYDKNLKTSHHLLLKNISGTWLDLKNINSAIRCAIATQLLQNLPRMTSCGNIDGVTKAVMGHVTSDRLEQYDRSMQEYADSY